MTGWTKKDIANQFEIDESELDGCEFIYVDAGEDWSGELIRILFYKNGKIYEVSAGHCSCYGFEGQWDPEETTIEELRFRNNEELNSILDIYEKKQTPSV